MADTNMANTNMAALPRLPLYRPELYSYYKTIMQYLSDDVEEHLYTVLRNIMLCLAVYERVDMIVELGSITSLDGVYRFLAYHNDIDWDDVFGNQGIITDNTVKYGGPSTVFDGNTIEITDVYQAYPRSSEGGLSSQLIRVSDIISLQHETTVRFDSENGNEYQNLIDILSSGALTINTWRKDQFPAVYFIMDHGTPHTTIGRMYPNPWDDNVVLIFSAAILMSPSWHTNAGLMYGRVDESSYDPVTFHKLLFTSGLRSVGEIVVHHACPFEYLEAIVAHDSQVDDVRKVVNNLPIKYQVLSATEYKAGPFRRHLKHINVPISFPYPPLSLALAWYAITQGIGHASLNTVRKTLINYGISEVEVKRICREYPILSIIEYIQNLNEQVHVLTQPVVIHPPY